MVGRGVSSRCHEPRPVLQVGFVLIVGPAAKLDVVDLVRPALCVRNSVVKLDLPGGRATSTFGVNEDTSPLIPLKHLPAVSSRNRARLDTALLPAHSRSFGQRSLLLSRFSQQRIQCPLEDFARVAVRDLVTQKILKLSKLVSSFLPNGNLKLVTPGRKGDGPRL
jgi:hypothetical protein